MNSEQNKKIDIIVVTYNRKHLLEKTIKSIYERTRYPHRVWVIDNLSTDGETINYLKKAKLHGYIYDYIQMPENLGLAAGYSEGFKKVTSDYFITTQDDCIPPDLRPCWLERMVHLMDKYCDEYAGISMRIQRLRHREIDEFKELIESKTSLASVFRIQKREDIEKIGGFGNRPHWESTAFVNRAEQLKKKFAVATHLYADHIGFMPTNKGFAEGFTNYHTYSQERVNQGDEQPYPRIDYRSNIPLEIETSRDRDEQSRREAFWKYWGVDEKNRGQLEEQKLLGKYASEGKGLDIGCGRVKCHPNAIGFDIFPFQTVDIIGDARELWMFKDNELDFIVCSHVLEHMPDFKSALKEWSRVIKPGGILAVAVPDGEAHPSWIRSTSHKVNLGPASLKIVFRDILGMEILEGGIVPNKKGGRHQTAYMVGRKK